MRNLPNFFRRSAFSRTDGLQRRTIVLFLAVGSLIGGLVTSRDIWFTIFYLFSLLLILSFAWSWTNLHWSHIGRFTRTRRTRVGGPLDERFTMRNTSLIPKLWLELRDLSTVPNHFSSRVVSTLGPRRETSWRVSTICTQRGRYQLGPMTLYSSDPFGLFPLERDITAQTSVVIYPMAVDIHQFALPLGLLPGGDALRRRTHYVTTNASGVRDYAPGDSFSRIHWASTARRGRLIVKEFELDPLADIWIIPDMAQFVHTTANDNQSGNYAANDISNWMKQDKFSLPPATEEYTVTIAASLAQYFLRLDRSVGLMGEGQSFEMVQPDRGERQLNRILETLAVLSAQGRVPIQDLMRSRMQYFPRGTTVIIISPTTQDEWVTAASQLVRRGLRVVTVFVDPASFNGTKTNQALVPLLQASGVGTYFISRDDDLTTALSTSTMRAGYYSLG
ncbi:MAG TPA: DUF58 domain-containing protein [Anaerolineae bacterium]|nr:DUF58 domain-containing protein [Anaerolineae bacterium]